MEIILAWVIILIVSVVTLLGVYLLARLGSNSNKETVLTFVGISSLVVAGLMFAMVLGWSLKTLTGT